MAQIEGASDTIQLFEAQLSALERLRQEATEEERAFYSRAAEEIRGHLERERSRLERPEPRTLERARRALRARYPRLYALERTRDDPAAGPHAHRWAEEEIEEARLRIAHLEAELAELDPGGAPEAAPPRDQERGRLEDALEDARSRVEEVEVLQGLHLSWMARAELDEAAAGEAGETLARIEADLAQAREAAEAAEGRLAALDGQGSTG